MYKGQSVKDLRTTNKDIDFDYGHSDLPFKKLLPRGKTTKTHMGIKLCLGSSPSTIFLITFSYLIIRLDDS